MTAKRPLVVHIAVGARATSIRGTCVVDVAKAAGLQIDWDKLGRTFWIRNDRVSDFLAAAEAKGCIIRLRNEEDAPQIDRAGGAAADHRRPGYPPVSAVPDDDWTLFDRFVPGGEFILGPDGDDPSGDDAT